MKKGSEDIYPEILYKNRRKDKSGHTYCFAKCPHCFNFFEARTDLIKSGNTKSCGCLKHKRTPNTYYFPQGCDFGLGFYDNTDNYFIFDIDKYDLIRPYHWSDKNINGRHEPITSINGKTTSLAKFLLGTPDDLDSEHINQIPSDNRMCNLRTATRAQNSKNKKSAKGDSEYDEFSYTNSQKIAKTIETNQFNNSFHFLGRVLEDINNLPEKNVYKIILRNLFRNKLNGVLTESNEARLLLQLISDYKSA